MRTRLPALGIIAVLVILSVAVVIVIDPLAGGGPGSSPGPSRASIAVPTPETHFEVLEVHASGVGPDFSIDGGNAPTSDVAQSKLWFRDGAWWGVLIAEGTDEFRIHRFDWAGERWIDTGVPVATRASVQPDVLSEGEQLWVATGGGQPTPRRTAALFRYAYSSETGQYALDSDFPVTIADEQARALTIARDASGRLWAAWINDERLKVSHTVGNDWTWAEGFVPAAPGGEQAPDAIALVGYEDSVALLWTSEATDTLSMAVPTIGETVAWDGSTVTVDGLAPADDHLDVTVVETGAGPRVLAVVETSLDELPASSDGDPKVILVAIDADRSAGQYLVSRIADDQARPSVLVDGENEVVYVIATTPASGGAITTKASSLDDLSFATGEGLPLIDIDALTSLSDATSTRQTLSSASGLVVLASDPATGRYAWIAARLPGENAPNTEPVPEPRANDAPILMATFDPFSAGSSVDAMWATRSSGEAAFVIADRDGRRVAEVVATQDGSTARMCREISPQTAGLVRIEADVMLSRAGLSDAAVTTARHDGAQTAVVRLDDSGVFSFFDGETQVRSEVPWRPGVWYTSMVTLDPDARTYDWRVMRLSDSAIVFGVDGARWRTAATGPLTDVCLESPESTSSATVFAIDRVSVELER